jgi:hypothetical protein
MATWIHVIAHGRLITPDCIDVERAIFEFVHDAMARVR